MLIVASKKQGCYSSVTTTSREEVAVLKIAISITLTALVGGFVLIESGIIDSLLTFLLSGTLPGTSVTLSPNIMMIGFASIAWLVLVRMTALGALNIVTIKRLLHRREKHRARMPKKRYGPIPSSPDR